MSFHVTFRQHPVDQPARLITAELSSHDLQLKLIKAIDDVIKINGEPVTPAQKEILRDLGSHREAAHIDVQGGVLYFTGRFEGKMRTYSIFPDGTGFFMAIREPKYGLLTGHGRIDAWVE